MNQLFTTLILSIMLTGATGAPPRKIMTQGAYVTNIQQSATNHLKAFQATHNPAELDEAIDLLEIFQPETGWSPAKKRSFRTEKLQIQLAVLNQLDTNLEPGFNQNDLPSL